MNLEEANPSVIRRNLLWITSLVIILSLAKPDFSKFSIAGIALTFSNAEFWTCLYVLWAYSYLRFYQANQMKPVSPGAFSGVARHKQFEEFMHEYQEAEVLAILPKLTINERHYFKHSGIQSMRRSEKSFVFTIVIDDRQNKIKPGESFSYDVEISLMRYRWLRAKARISQAIHTDYFTNRKLPYWYAFIGIIINVWHLTR